MRIVIENVSPENVAKLLELLGQDALTIDAGAKSNGNGASAGNGSGGGRSSVKTRKPKAPKAPASSGTKIRCSCGADYSYRKSFESHLVVNPDHREVF